MNKALIALLNTSSCTDLVNVLELTLRSIELKSIENLSEVFNNILNNVFQKTGYEQETKGVVKHLLPDHIYIILAILALFAGDTYIHRFALRFSRLYKYVVLDVLDDENIVKHGKALNIRLEYSGEKCYKEVFVGVTKKGSTISLCLRYRMPINEYLRVAGKLLTEHTWKLSSNFLSKGYVYIDSRDKVLRLLAEHIYNTISLRLKNARASCEDLNEVREKLMLLLQDFHQDLVPIVTMFLENLDKHKQLKHDAEVETESVKSIESIISEVDSVEKLIAISHRMFPPCIRELIDALAKGENLSHHQRFALATFLINIGVSLDLIQKLFSFSPDFNEKITRYQLEHLAGLRGSKKKYLVYSCSTMKTLGMCRAECGTKNPLTYLKRRSASADKK